jgi:hypothetical protein
MALKTCAQSEKRDVHKNRRNHMISFSILCEKILLLQNWKLIPPLIVILLNWVLLINFFLSLRSSQSARVSCHIHSTQSVGAWWCSLVALRLILCTRTPWIAGLRSSSKKEQRPSSKVHCRMCSVELVALSSWSSTMNSRSSFKSFKIIIIIVVIPTTTTIATFILTAEKIWYNN